MTTKAHVPLGGLPMSMWTATPGVRSRSQPPYAVSWKPSKGSRIRDGGLDEPPTPAVARRHRCRCRLRLRCQPGTNPCPGAGKTANCQLANCQLEEVGRAADAGRQ